MATTLYSFLFASPVEEVHRGVHCSVTVTLSDETSRDFEFQSCSSEPRSGYHAPAQGT